jgi:hypothetical protein
MKVKLWLVLALLIACTAVAQEQKQPQMSAEEKAQMDAWQKYMTPGEGHKALDQMVGTWDTKVTMWQKPGAQPAVSTGVSENRWVLGNRYVEEHFKGTFMGMPFEGIGYTGYDNAKKQYLGTWMDNFGTGVMTSSGNTTDRKVWTFKSSSTDPMTGKDMPVESRMTFADADHHTFEMFSPGPDGKMFKMMEIAYTRKK